MGNLSLQCRNLSLQYVTSLYVVRDVYPYSMWHLSLQYGASLYTVWHISIYSMGHLTIPCGTSIYAAWEIYLHSIWNISLQYWTSTYAVWDIYLYRMGHPDGTYLITVCRGGSRGGGPGSLGIDFYSGFREKKHKGGGVQFEILRNRVIDFYSGFREQKHKGGCNSKS